MAEYLRLFDPTQQFQLKNGMINVSGRLYVYLSETDDLAEIFDENGVRLQQPAILDNNGRARGLFVDSAKTYWMDVQDQYGESLFTIRRMTPCGGGGGSVLGIKEIISTDGSISIDKYTEAGETTYDIGIAPQSDEFLEWCNCSEDNISNGNWYPTVLEGTMESQVGYGLHVNKGQLYHITTNIKVDPTGAGINYDTLSANLMFNDGEEHNVVRRNYDVDSSVNDPTLCEFSYDFVPENDGFIYLGVEGVGYFEHVSVSMQVHRVYSGINAVPDTYATKQWVHDTFDSSMSSKISYSALEYDTIGNITGISGTAIVGLDSATVSAIASSYAESAASSKVDTSSMSAYVPFSGLETDNGKITSISGTALGGHEYSGVWPVIVDNTADTIAVLNKTLAIDETMTGYESAGSAVIGVNTGTVLSGLTAYQTVADMTAYQPVGDYAFNSSLSAKLDASASSDFYSTSNPSGFITGVDLSDYQPTSAMTAYQSAGDYAYNSALSSKLDASASSQFVTTEYIDSSLSSKQDISAMTAYQSAGDYAYNSSLSAKLDASASSEFYPYSGNPSGFLTAHQSLAGYATESYVDSSVSSKLDATASSQFLTSLPADLAYTSDVASAVSGKLDASASSSFYPMTSNPSGYLTAHQSLAGYATVEYVDSSVSSKLDSSAYDSSLFYPMSGNPSSFLVTDDISGKMDVSAMTAYQSAGDYADASALSSKLDASASSQFVTSLTGYATEEYVDSSVSAKLDATASSQFITSTAGLQPAGDYAFNSSLSSKMDASESSSFYPMDSNPSGYLTAHQSLDGYATESYVDSSVSSKLDATASSQFITSLSGYATEEYVDSSVSAKLDATASSQFITSLAGYATETYVDSSVSSKMDASESSAFYPMDSNPSGYLTAHQSLAGYATTTYVDSSVSSKLDTTAQVVSATATQLYAGTAYLTSVNGTPISATRAGNAVNAVNATSAWYDSTGRALSSLQSQLTFGYSGTAISSIDGSALVGGGGGKTYSGVAPIIVDNTADTISVSSMELVCDSSLSAYESAGQKVLMVSTALFGTAIY